MMRLKPTVRYRSAKPDDSLSVVVFGGFGCNSVPVWAGAPYIHYH
jgi:hypothetical protein